MRNTLRRLIASMLLASPATLYAQGGDGMDPVPLVPPATVPGGTSTQGGTALPPPPGTVPTPGALPPPPTSITALPPPPSSDAAPASDKAGPGSSVKESVVPGSEPHSPATWGNAYNDPSNKRVMTGLNGASGLLHVGSADLGRPGVLRFSLMGEYFTSQNFPVLQARDTRSAGTFALDYTFVDFLEGYLSYASAANTNSKASPPLIQAMGDVNLGVKAATEVAKGFTAGGDLRLNIFPGLGGQDIRKYAFGFSPRLLGTYDIRTVAPKVPLRAHLNAIFNLDGSGKLVSKALTPAEEFALGVNRFNRMGLALGLEAPLPVVTPFLEYGFAYPLGAKSLIGPDQKAVTAGASMPHQLSLGGKITAVRDIAFVAAVDLGLARSVAGGIPATMPWDLFFGASYNVDLFSRGETRLVERTTVVEKKTEVATAPPVYTGKVGGVVLDAETKQPIAGAVVAMVGLGMPPVASDVEGGKFVTYDLPGGKVQLTAVKDGYKPAAQEAVVEAGKVSAVQLMLMREAKNGAVNVSLVSGKTKVSGKVTITGPKGLEINTDATGAAKGELPQGKYVAAVDATGYLAKTREFEVTEGGTVHLDFDLAPVPKQSLVVVKENKIEIKQQVHFATGKATILGDSFALLDQVVDAIVRTNIKKVRVEGHTDNQGKKELNLKLSQDRAQSVMDYLKSHGVEASRLVSEGYGDTKPVAPNLTARGRELNRRVEFVILEK